MLVFSSPFFSFLLFSSFLSSTSPLSSICSDKVGTANVRFQSRVENNMVVYEEVLGDTEVETKIDDEKAKSSKKYGPGKDTQTLALSVVLFCRSPVLFSLVLLVLTLSSPLLSSLFSVSAQ
jgi:hypothetical protein